MENLDRDKIEKIVRTRKQANSYYRRNLMFTDPSWKWNRTLTKTEHLLKVKKN